MATSDRKTSTILVVDDDPDILEAYQDILAPGKGSVSRPIALFDTGKGRQYSGEGSSPFHLLTASQGEEAVELVRSYKESGNVIEAVFVDIRMPPGIDGLETAKRLRSIDPDLQIVIVTAYSDYPFYEIANQLGKRKALYYLEKPFAASQVRQFAHSLVQQWAIKHELALTFGQFLQLTERRAKDWIARGDVAEGLRESLLMIEDLTGAKSLALVRHTRRGKIIHVLGTGLLENQRDVDRARRSRIALEIVEIEDEETGEGISGAGHDDAVWMLIMMEPAQSRDLCRSAANTIRPYLPYAVEALAAEPDSSSVADAKPSARASRKHDIRDSADVDEQRATEGLTEFHGILTSDPAMLGLFDQIRRVAKQEVPIFITGETGSGKEMVARAIHLEGSRSKKIFVSVNCANLTEQLLESQLFGHRKGAFTGAVAEQKGLLAEADGGTLFLDEVTEIPMHLQPKLLRVLQEREYTPLGSTRPISFDTLIISASQSPLQNAVQEGRFRPDLKYRLHVIPLGLPPLWARSDDSSALFEHFLHQAYKAQRGDVPIPEISPEVWQVIRHYEWPGNVRELQNACAYVVAMTTGSIITIEHLPEELRFSLVSQIQEGLGKDNQAAAKGPSRSIGNAVALDRMGSRLSTATPDEAHAIIQDTLSQTNGNRSEAARRLGISRMTLWRRMQALGLAQGDK